MVEDSVKDAARVISTGQDRTGITGATKTDSSLLLPKAAASPAHGGKRAEEGPAQRLTACTSARGTKKEQTNEKTYFPFN